MTRQERRAINRENAKHSTGPVTDAGKQTSAANATTHGLTSMKPYLPSEEDAYRAFEANRLESLAPETGDEANLVATIIDLEWRLKRIPILEARLFAADEEDTMKIIRALDVLSRHEVRLRKLLVTIHAELHELVINRRRSAEENNLPAD